MKEKCGIRRYVCKYTYICMYVVIMCVHEHTYVHQLGMYKIIMNRSTYVPTYIRMYVRTNMHSSPN